MATLLVPPPKPPIRPELLLSHKMYKLRQLSDAIVKERGDTPTKGRELRLHSLERQRQELKASLPPLRIVE